MKKLVLITVGLFLFNQAFSKEYKLYSPDKKTEVTISVDSEIAISASNQSGELLSMNNISLDIKGEEFTSAIKKVKKDKIIAVNKKIYPEIKEKFKEINENYNELFLDFKSDFAFTVLAYNNGIAYRFNTTFEKDLVINEENFNSVMGELRGGLSELLRKTIRPEFLNRIDEIVLFKPLLHKEIKSIIDIQLRNVEKLLAEKEIKLNVTDSAKDFIMRTGYDVSYGARPHKRMIQKYINNPLSTEILIGTFSA